MIQLQLVEWFLSTMRILSQILWGTALCSKLHDKSSTHNTPFTPLPKTLNLDSGASRQPSQQVLYPACQCNQVFFFSSKILQEELYFLRYPCQRA